VTPRRCDAKECRDAEQTEMGREPAKDRTATTQAWAWGVGRRSAVRLRTADPPARLCSCRPPHVGGRGRRRVSSGKPGSRRSPPCRRESPRNRSSPARGLAARGSPGEGHGGHRGSPLDGDGPARGTRQETSRGRQGKRPAGNGETHRWRTRFDQRSLAEDTPRLDRADHTTPRARRLVGVTGGEGDRARVARWGHQAWSPPRTHAR
jgi:hypothetical protein